ncbi:MAG: hypothetical protein GY719_30730 [bacterium]|nr:hypothetical protein [bacterium]
MQETETAESVPSALGHGGPSARARDGGGRFRRDGALWRSPSLLVLILVLIVAAVMTARLIRQTAPAVDLPLEGRLALLPFLDSTADRSGEWVENGLMEMVAETVARTTGPALLSPERLRRLMAPRELDLRDSAAREQARQLALASGVDQVLDVAVLGRDGENAEFEIALFDGTGLVAEARLEGEGPLSVADELAFALARGLTSELEPRRLAQQFSRSPFLDRLYATGLQVLRSSGPDHARHYFRIALDHQAGFAQAKARLAECARSLGELDRSRRLTRELLQDAQVRGARALEADHLRDLALLAALDGELAQATEHYDQAFGILLDLQNRPAQADVLFEQSRLALAAGDEARAEELYVERLRIQQQLGDRLGEADTLFQIGSLLLSNGDLEGALQMLTDARELSTQTADIWTEMRVVASLGEVARQRGEAAAAQDLWRRALSFYDQQEESSRRLLLNFKLAESLIDTGDLQKAETRLHNARELAGELDNKPIEAKASLGLAWLMLRTGYPYQAKPHLDRALELDSWLDDRVLLQLAIAWYAYEQGNYRLAVQTQSEVKRRLADRWKGLNEQFLQTYRQAQQLGRRLPLPGEDDYEEPAAG